MLEYRLKAYHQFLALANPDWGCDLSELNFDELTYYSCNPYMEKRALKPSFPVDHW